MISNNLLSLCYLTLLTLVRRSAAAPVSQPAYPTGDYAGIQSLLPQQEQSQPLYISIPRTPTPQPAVYNAAAPAYTPPTQLVPQLLLPTNVDRQIQRVANKIAGPGYADTLSVQQQQGLANQVQATAERRAAWQASRQRQAIVAANEAIARATQEREGGGYAAAQTPNQYQVEYQPQYVYQPEPQAQYQVQTSVKPPKQYQPQIYPAQARSNGKQTEEEEQYDDANSSYKFGFDVTDDENTNYHNRQEQRDGKKISGSYSVVDSDGFIRTVTYTADPEEGFKAEVVRKPTDIVVKIPKPTPPPKDQYVQVPKNLYQYE
ncbi:uncharacterized protein [Onthophagus taurus]|uniref:uncharacterized protein n=1 Tax=Onthophagus taurus TaxID=166361 RepID=UPI0039BEBE1E